MIDFKKLNASTYSEYSNEFVVRKFLSNYVIKFIVDSENDILANDSNQDNNGVYDEMSWENFTSLVYLGKKWNKIYQADIQNKNKKSLGFTDYKTIENCPPQNNNLEMDSMAYMDKKMKWLIQSENKKIQYLGIHIKDDSFSTNYVNEYIDDINSTNVIKNISSEDNWISKRAEQLKYFLILEDVESGVASEAERFVNKIINENRVLGLQVINQVYIDIIEDKHCLIGLLYLCSHIDYNLGLPNIQTIALSALTNKDVDVVDYGVRCYENWNDPSSIKILESIKTDSTWLGEYIKNVCASISSDQSIGGISNELLR